VFSWSGSDGQRPRAKFWTADGILDGKDGFVVLETDSLPGRLCDLELTDLRGIADRTANRLARGGILTVEQLWHADPKFIRQILVLCIYTGARSVFALLTWSILVRIALCGVYAVIAYFVLIFVGFIATFSH
jgi:hypothetical protein